MVIIRASGKGAWTSSVDPGEPRDHHSTIRRPGDRVIRRRLRPTQVIEIPAHEAPKSPPSPYFHARLFILIFVGILTVGSLLLMLPWVTNRGIGTAPIDALFTAMSALSVTGLVTLDTATHWNFAGQLIILILIQVGGLGFMVGASLVLRVIGGARLRHHMLIQDNIPTLSLHEAVTLAGKVALFTFLVEAVGAVLLTMRFMQDLSFADAVWHGIFHSVAAFCNAGFDLQGNFASFIGYQDSVWINVVLIGLIQAGAISYMALADVVDKRNWRRLAVNTKLVMTINLVLVVGGMIAFLGAEWNGVMQNTPTWTRPLQALFQSVSARTAGFATIDFGETSTFTDFFWVALMFVGGASGSTAGGVKMATVGIALVAVYSEIRGNNEPEVFHRRIPLHLVLRAITVITLFFLVHFTMTLALAGTEHLYGQQPSFVAVFFETMSAQATVGVSTGITPGLSTPGKLILVATMFIGWLGPLTVVYALQQREHVRKYRYPEATVHIG